VWGGAFSCYVGTIENFPARGAKDYRALDTRRILYSLHGRDEGEIPARFAWRGEEGLIRNQTEPILRDPIHGGDAHDSRACEYGDHYVISTESKRFLTGAKKKGHDLHA